jgi:hypothetical protein
VKPAATPEPRDHERHEAGDEQVCRRYAEDSHGNNRVVSMVAIVL